MKRGYIYNKGVVKMARRLAVGCLLLFFLASHAMAQTDGRFVIKKKVEAGDNGAVHYLSHSENAVQDATAFNPETCLWISDNHYTQGGTNKNYYFMDGTTPRFLAANEFQAGGALSISTSQPPTSYLNNPESPFYFYKWDGGLGRGVQYFGDCATSQAQCQSCGHVWGDGQCWDVYWVSYYDNVWKLSTKHYNLNEVPYGAQFHAVAITEHDRDTTTVSGGLTSLQDFEMEYQANPLTTHQVTPSISDYQYSVRPAYTTYVFDGGTHNYYDDGQGGGAMDHGETLPNSQNSGTNYVANATYAWTITGDGATYLSIDNASSATPTITYSTPNNTGHETATLTLTVTYQDGSKQRSSATILVKTPCQNPLVMTGEEVVTYVGVTVSWHPTAESYLVSWKETTASTWSSHEVGNVTSYTITGLEYEATYEYKVKATSCTTSDPIGPYPTFTTLAEPGLMVTGAIFGGGRMADVGTTTGGGNTEIVIINCDSVGVLYGGNDIAGKVHGGSKITLGVKTGDPNGYDVTYGTTNNGVSLNFSSVYGGGNGYYAYNGESFVAANSDYTSETVEVGASIKAMTDLHHVGEVVWTNGSDAPKTLHFPAITNTNILVTDDFVTVDSIFGGAKNAFLTTDSGDGSLITINGGTVFAVFGGNNWGGSQGYGKHHIVVNKTTTNLAANIINTATTGYGRTFGIRYLFGGGNKVEGSTTDVYINGGQLDDVFAGGNAADVYKANVTVNCEIAASSDGITFGKVYSNAIQSYSEGVITPKTTYGWDGINGIYNVRTLYGGNNEAEMTRLPVMTLTSGSIGTIYGGGNAGDMMGQASGQINGNDILYGTYVVMNSAVMIADYLYGGCRMSNVANSTKVELRKGHVGNVYGGCNISGDVGSTRVNPDAPNVPQTLEDQKVKGATYVLAGGNTGDNIIVYKDLFAGSNGYYNCSTDGIVYNNDTYFDDPTGQYAGMTVPTHNETNVFVSDGALIKGNVYAGGNLACVGFDDGTGFFRGYPELVGMASVFMDGGEVEQNVYGGGNMASIFGENSVRVSGGTIGLALYGGNDRAGQVAEKTNRVLPYDYTIASDGVTSLTDLGVKTYVGVSGDAQIGTVYGGGNGDYPPGSIQYCHDGDNEPIQSHTFVDIHLDGGANGGHVRTVYGGGNGVTVRHGVTVFLNVQNPAYATDAPHVDTVFGGNNKGALAVVPDIRMVHGKVGTVYGGCNRGAMTATGDNLKTIEGYEDIGSYVRLRHTYNTQNDVDAQVTQAIYGGCRMNGVTNNSLVLVEGGDFSAMTGGVFGGSDISGTVSGNSRVAVTGGTVGTVYGGGNGNYDYENGGNVYKPGSAHIPANLVATGITSAPICVTSGADILEGSVGTTALLGAGTVSKVFGGGYGPGTQTTGNVVVNIGRSNAASAAVCPVIYGEIYGGSAFGTVNSSASNSTTVNFLNGTMKKATVNNVDYGGNVFGGGLGDAGDASKGQVNGKVYVYISNDTQDPDNCFIDLRQANVYGCNNTNGSPQDDVTVHVYKTAYNFSDYTSGNHYTSQEGEDPYYAINQVFGGGNQADYAPNGGNVNSTKKTLVYVHDCSNTIRRVFAGGNAAAATGVSAIIEGGRFDYVFGGGNGEVEPANIGLGGTNTTLSAGFVNHLFGGSNMRGEITGPVNTLVSGDHVVQPGGVGIPCGENITEFFGGSNEANLNANVTTVVECGTGMVGTLYGGCNKADIEGDVTLTVRGGQYDYVYGGSKGVTSNGADITGNVTLNLEGGTIGDHTGGTSGNEFGGAFGGSNVRGNITGSIIVNVIDIEQCPLDVTNIYGAGNQADYTPSDNTIISPLVNVMHIKQDEGVRKNVFGGGNEASVASNPRVNIGYDATSMSSIITALGISTGSLTSFPHVLVTGSVFGGGNVAQVDGSITVNVYNGEIVHKLVGGGNNLGYTGPNDINVGVTGNVVVNISGGQLCTEPTGDGAGVYGGCNESGIVNGDITLNITGSTASPANQTTIGTEAALNVAAAGVPDPGDPVSIHGGGFGEYTRTKGDVTVNFGFDNGTQNSECIYPMLYGDLYGGSALGTVNDAASDKTTVNVCNGSLQYVTTMYGTPVAKEYQYGGNIYGGGLGRKADPANSITAAVADVNGVVYVKIGADAVAPSTKPTGKAHLKGCNVFGGNNTNGSPQQNVYVDVYQTAHEENDSVNINDDHWYNYAIRNVYGGGNQSHYHPASNEGFLKKAHNSIHYCNNTIEYVYGGGNAAWTDGTVVSVDGGRFKFIFGGGNGQSGIGADILDGGVNISIYGGHVGWYFSGCNLHGNIGGGAPVEQYGCTAEYCPCGDELVVERYYFGANEALTVGGLTHKINCGDNMNFKYVYAGSRLAQVYGDIKLWVRGGNIANLFGGSEGSNEVSADVLRYPTEAEVQAAQPGDYPQAVLDYLEEHHDQYGQGGNIFLILEGGTLHKVYGGNDYRGNVEGNITVFVDDAMSTECPLTIDTLYGGNRLAGYEPLDGSTRISPIVYLKNGRVEEDVFGGSLGGNSTHPYGNGIVKSNPLVVIGDDGNEPKAEVGRDVFGGGSAGEMIGSPRVVLQGKATIENNVFGGSKQSTVDGNTDVAIASTTPIITVPETPVPPTHKFIIQIVQPTGAGCTVTVTDNLGSPVPSGADVLEGEALHLEATVSEGYTFAGWSVGDEPGGGTLTNPTSTSSIYYMGTRDVTLTATFTARGRHNER